jgi:hypothetical protein
MEPKDILNNPEQIKNLIDVLQSLLQTSEKQTKDNDKHDIDDYTINNKIKTKNKRTKNNKSINKFEQMSEFGMHKDDLKIDEKLAKHPPVARLREFEPIIVTCRKCGKKESVNPSLVYEGPTRYKCNNCSTQAG